MKAKPILLASVLVLAVVAPRVMAERTPEPTFPTFTFVQDQAGVRDSLRRIDADGGQSERELESPGNLRLRQFVSPDRTLVAVTTEPYGTHGAVLTHLIDPKGNLMTAARPGSFISWLPNGEGALLFVTNPDEYKSRAIYTLTPAGDYRDLGLPDGVVSADVSPVTGEIAYSVSATGTDDTSLWLRDEKGEDRMVREREGATFAWLRWAPDGSALTLSRSQIGTPDPAQRTLRVLSSDGVDETDLGPVMWNYPAQWSPQADRLLFARPNAVGLTFGLAVPEAQASTVWEFDAKSRTTGMVIQVPKGRVLHPSYAANGESILYVSDETGTDQVWIASGGKQRQLTTTEGNKRYPIGL